MKMFSSRSTQNHEKHERIKDIMGYNYNVPKQEVGACFDVLHTCK